MKIGEYIICKNEIKHIDNWIKELIKLDEICILDTGSTDGTFERLLEWEKQYPHIHVKQKIYNPFYFDVARNDALDFARQYLEEGDWLLTLDLDEYVSRDFVEIIRPQLEAKPDAMLVCLWNKSDNTWHWQGHRCTANCKWFFHIHEAILNLNKKELGPSIYLKNASYIHNQDTSKPRDYRRILKEMVQLEPTCTHYLINSLMEEEYAKDEKTDIAYCERIRDQILESVMNNPDDSHYHDYEYAVQACANIEFLPEDRRIKYIETFRKIEEEIENYGSPNFRFLHIILARLLQQYEDSKYDKEIEFEFLQALQFNADLGWWVDLNCSNEEILSEFLIWLYYKKKDIISASYYMQQLFLQKPYDWAKNDLINYGSSATNMNAWILVLDQRETIRSIEQKIVWLQSVNNKSIAVIVSRDLSKEEWIYLLNLNVSILFNNFKTFR